jgi:hypothetical protein
MGQMIASVRVRGCITMHIPIAIRALHFKYWMAKNATDATIIVS